MGKLIDPAPIIKKLAERCLVTKGIECSILGEVIDLLKAAPSAEAKKAVQCKNCEHRYYNYEIEEYCCEQWGDGYDTVIRDDEYCSRWVEMGIDWDG